MYNYSNNCMYTEYNYSYLSTILIRIQFLYEYNFYILISLHVNDTVSPLKSTAL